MPQRCKDCSAPLPQSWSGPLRHCPACGSVVNAGGLYIKEVKVEKVEDAPADEPAPKKKSTRKSTKKK